MPASSRSAPAPIILKRPGSSRDKWVLVAVLCCLGALNYCDRSAIAAVLAPIRSDLGISDRQLGVVGSCFLWSYMIAALFGGVLADRWSRSRLILYSLIGWSLITLATGFVTTFSQLIATRILLGIVEAAYVPAAVALIADFHPRQTRATAIGLHLAALPVGIIVGGASLGWIGDHDSWRVGFILLGLLGLALAVLTRLLVHDIPTPIVDPGADRVECLRLEPNVSSPAHRAGPHSILTSFTTLARTPLFVAMVIATMIVGLGNWIFLYWLPLYFRETYHMNLAASGFAGTFMLQGAAIAGSALGGFFSDRFAAKKSGRRMWLQIISYTIAAPFLGIFLLPHPPLIPLNLCMFGFSFFLWFGTCNVLPLSCDILPPGLRSTAVSVVASTGTMAGGIGVLLTGFLKAQIGLGGVFAGISALALLAAGILLACRRIYPEIHFAKTNSSRFSPPAGFPESSTHS